MLKLENVSKTFKTSAFGRGRMQAVRKVNFGLGEGEVLALIGESGSGKTTIGRMILRLSAISEGRILHQGADISTISGRALKNYYRHVQGVFQDPFSSFNPIFKTKSMFDALKRGYFSPMARDLWQQKLDSSIKAVGLRGIEILGHYPHQLSGGQLQRLLIARALLLDIKLLVADEITSMLDASTRIDVLNLLGALKAKGLGIVFITHDLALGHYISDRIVILRHGAVVEIGPTEKVFTDPRHAYTRMLLASVPRLAERWDAAALKQAPAGAGFCPDDGQENLVAVDAEHFVAGS